MSDCERVSDLFGELIEKRLDGETEKYVNDHLAVCHYCHEDYQWYGITIKTLSNLEEMSPPDHLLGKIKAEFHESASHTSIFESFRQFFSYSPYMPLPVGVGALALVVFIGIVVYDRTPHEVISTSSAMVASAEGPSRTPSTTGGQAQTNLAQRFGAKPQAESAVVKGGVGDKSSPFGHLQQYAMSTPRILGEEVATKRTHNLSMADIIGADNLTVESKSIPSAVDSLKRMLPHLEGSLVEERSHDRMGEIILGVVIPSSAYGRLTTELVNHGALASGTGLNVTPPASRAQDSNKVVLYIRFINSP